MNVYHDGKEGLAQHFDDAVRFKQPIYTLRLFSDCRLSFGSQFYGFCNGAFCIPLPRGCVCVMEGIIQIILNHNYYRICLLFCFFFLYLIFLRKFICCEWCKTLR